MIHSLPELRDISVDQDSLEGHYRIFTSKLYYGLSTALLLVSRRFSAEYKQAQKDPRTVVWRVHFTNLSQGLLFRPQVANVPKLELELPLANRYSLWPIATCWRHHMDWIDVLSKQMPDLQELHIRLHMRPGRRMVMHYQHLLKHMNTYKRHAKTKTVEVLGGRDLFDEYREWPDTAKLLARWTADDDTLTEFDWPEEWVDWDASDSEHDGAGGGSGESIDGNSSGGDQ
jgi:hypothetical protein